MRPIDADAIPYTMLYKEDWIKGTGQEKQGAWKEDIDKIPTIEPKLCSSCPYNPVNQIIRNGGEEICPDAYREVAEYCNYNRQKREVNEDGK